MSQLSLEKRSENSAQDQKISEDSSLEENQRPAQEEHTPEKLETLS